MNPGAFDALLKGECDYSVVPFENSTNGSVVFTFDILRDIIHAPGTKSNGNIAPPLQVVEEVFVPINHCLLTTATDLSQVKRLYTHPQAWGQVDHYLAAHFSPADVERLDTDSTSAAVGIAKTDSEGAAIASSAASVVHDVPIFQANISNKKDNTTRFLVFARADPQHAGSAVYPDPALHVAADVKREKKGSLASFIVQNDKPGALCATLQEFAQSNISLTSINSRPSGKGAWSYVFYIEFEGDALYDNAVSSAVARAAKNCLEFCILGSFYRA
ncbi:hypothetical protein DV451_002906 [Geotrichum candidum]|uniref:Prephenate dehydratase n=1 Tax=Geotrichum candidum TaxID=1173061 RepID=A0A9P5G430_GEOCN|nr:hypothetical protein DV451_002906 [Geotrichum candidum]KAF5110719.1 hypothetical protein DV453_000776 [Geotrichum candidum]